MGICGLVVGFAAPFLVALDAQERDSSLFRHNPRLHPATTISATRKRDLCILYSQLSQKQIAEDIRKRYLSPLLEAAGIPFLDETVVVEKLSDLGFANNVFRVTVDPGAALSTHHNSQTATEAHGPQLVLVAKIFSDLAKKRVDPHQSFMGEVDELLYRHGLGPRVLAHTPDAILMDYIDGQVLTESLIFGDHDNTMINEKGLSICTKVGEKLGNMHSLPGKGGPNMLWHAMDVLLSSVDEKQCQLTTDSGSSWSLSKLRDTVGSYRGRLEALDIPCVDVGHGDFKLTNVMITHATQEIQFIDFELSGTHYRGYDLAKFFRSSKQQSTGTSGDRSLYQQALWESYCKSTAINKNEVYNDYISKSDMDKAVSQLQWEAQLLEPMTWLEAASFFLSMASLDDPSEAEKWSAMANSRLSSFEKMRLAVKEL